MDSKERKEERSRRNEGKKRESERNGRGKRRSEESATDSTTSADDENLLKRDGEGKS